MPKFADKYESEQALEQGFRELDKAVSGEMGRPPLADTVKLVGDGGMFKTHAELEASYVKTATVHGKMKAPEPKQEPKQTAPDPNAPKIGGGSEPKSGSELSIGGGVGGGDPNADDLNVDEIVTKAGLKTTDLVKQWDTEGKLTDAQYAAIQRARPGFGRKVIDQLARGMAAESALVLQAHNTAMEESYKVVGGKEQLDTLLRVEAPKFITDKAQQEAFDRMLKDPRTRVAAVKTIATMHAEAVAGGKANPIVGGSTGGGGSVSGAPTNVAELGKLMRRVQEGDRDAIRILGAMKPEEIEKLQRM